VVAGVDFGVSYFGVRDPRHVRTDLDEIAAAGFKSVTHTLSEHDLRYHAADLARIVEETKSRGLEAVLDPWGVAGLFGGEAYSELALVELDSRQIDAQGSSVPASCPNAPTTRALLHRWAKSALDLGADCLFWDEPHFYLGALRSGPRVACCRCAHCERVFLQQHGAKELPPEGDPVLEDFRGRSIAGLLTELLTSMRGAPARQTLCLLPHGEFQGAGTDDWERLAALEGWDRLATDPYWMDRPVSVRDFVSRQAKRLRSLCKATATEMEIWIQGIRIPRGDEWKIQEAVDAALGEGAQRIAFWSFRGTERMSSLTCEDPEAAWKTMLECVRKNASR
jgi:hypothetical protein